MGLFDKLLVGGGAALFGIIARDLYRDAQETKRRKNSPLSFDDGLSWREFRSIVNRVAALAPRVERVSIKGMDVILSVRSISGLTIWSAEIDFNDYGHLTGTYWLSSENSDSVIPKFIANNVRSEILSRVQRG